MDLNLELLKEIISTYLYLRLLAQKKVFIEMFYGYMYKCGYSSFIVLYFETYKIANRHWVSLLI